MDSTTSLPAFELDELLGTKLRALYHRKKGRDLFDVWHAIESGLAEPSAGIKCFRCYMAEGGHSASRAQFEEDPAGKRALHAFRKDVEPLLRPGIFWNFDVAVDAVLERIIAHLPGDPWKVQGQ